MWKLCCACLCTNPSRTDLSLLLEKLRCGEFEDFCQRCLQGHAELSDLGRKLQRILQRAFLRDRCLFKGALPPRPTPSRGSTIKLESNMERRYDKILSMEPEQWVRVDQSVVGVLASSPRSQIFGLSRVHARVGDHLTTIIGCDVPILICSIEGTGHFRVIGPAYVDCLMKGQAIGNLPEVNITLC